VSTAAAIRQKLDEVEHDLKDLQHKTRDKLDGYSSADRVVDDFAKNLPYLIRRIGEARRLVEGILDAS
jgi:soluble cytochrome b562